MPAPNQFRPFGLLALLAYCAAIAGPVAGHISRGDWGALLFWGILGLVGVDIASG